MTKVKQCRSSKTKRRSSKVACYPSERHSLTLHYIQSHLLGTYYKNRLLQALGLHREQAGQGPCSQGTYILWGWQLG